VTHATERPPLLRESTAAPGLDRLLRAERGLGLVVSCLEEQIGAEAILAVAEDADGDPVRVRAGECPEYLPRNEDVLQEWAASGEGARVHAVPGSGRSPRTTHVAAAPIRLPDRRFGMLCAGFSEAPVDPPVLWVMETYARMAALCLEDADAFRHLIGATAIDGLTGCLTYVALREGLADELERARRHDRSLACCFLDLDGFKQVNDSQGHAMGNQVLAAVGAALRGGARRTDTIGRYGGDEFVVVLPETDARAAVALCERLRRAIRRETGALLEDEIDASVGIAAWQDGWEAERLLAEADRALARAKSHSSGIVVGEALEGDDPRQTWPPAEGRSPLSARRA
jgi:diguanylate cyclase (GGDEF)-like protein